MYVGVQVTTTEIPTAQVSSFNTANAFVIGVGTAPTGVNVPAICASSADIPAAIGVRSGTNATLYDSLDTFLREAAGTGAVAYVSPMASASLANLTTALGKFDPSYGPGNLIASGISDWASVPVVGATGALGAHALSYNRVALIDLPDNTSAATLVSDIGTTYNAAGAGPLAFYAGNLTIPGLVYNTTRSVPPSAAIAGLAAQCDAAGNPNLAPAGVNRPFRYVTGPTTLVSGQNATYSNTDLQTLANNGINTFAVRSGQFVAYGIQTSLLPTTDSVFCQVNHARMRMRLQSDAQVLAEPYVFAQLDGQNASIGQFETALAGMLAKYYNIGALYGDTMNDAFSIDLTSVNTAATLQAGQLNALVNVRLSPDAPAVSIILNAVPITQAV